ncbi:hypothetical protein GGI35DRAFT_285608 [Trichoderma velutinum]
MARHGKGRGGGPIQKQEQASVLTPLVLSVLGCLYLPLWLLWPHCLWPCRCITGPCPAPSLLFFPLHLPSLSLSLSSLLLFLLTRTSPSSDAHRSVAFVQGIISSNSSGTCICRLSQMNGEADNRVSPRFPSK